MKLIVICCTFLLSNSFVFASDLVEKSKYMTKEKLLIEIPNEINDSLLKTGGRMQVDPATYLIGVQRSGDTIIFVNEIDYSKFEEAMKSATEMSSSEVKEFIMSDYFKDNMFGEDGSQKKYYANYSCSVPFIFQSLKKNITMQYKYLLDSGEYYGEFDITIDMCK